MNHNLCHLDNTSVVLRHPLPSVRLEGQEASFNRRPIERHSCTLPDCADKANSVSNVRF